MKAGVSTIYLGLGSNLGDRAAHLLQSITALTNSGLRLQTLSSIYETDPVDFLDQPNFLNLAAAFQSEVADPFAVLELCLQIESRLGRERTTPKGARTIDIDVLLMDDLTLEGTRNGVELILPHPRMHLRRFVLTPLVEIAPQLRHPALGETIYRLLDRANDSSGVRIYRG
ncbi:MAG: 2-amino-4-hydroxy-6-hydroxymethyldihydropteridine diphosphokinase [Blastocatellia bacterium]